jgi:folate-binding Fe-S cluster repair protein YgfZ
MRAVGPDAANFLHNQLTNDVLLMKPTQARLAAFCNAKGRMQASFVYYKRDEEEVLLVCRRDLMAQTLKRLSMFVLRAKVKLSDATEDFHLMGLAGDAVLKALCVDPLPRPPPSPRLVASSQRCSAANVPRHSAIAASLGTG